MKNSSLTFIADASSNHNCNLETAYKLIKSAKQSGADIIKFQHWVTARFINKERFEKLKIAHQKDWNQSVYDTYRKYEIPLEWIPKLKKCCDDNNIEFMLSEYDLESFDYTNQFVKRHKIGSGDIDYFPILEKVGKTNKQVFLAIGASNEQEINKAWQTIYESNGHNCYNNEIVLFQCNTNYNYSIENIFNLNLNYIKETSIEGLSDHTKSDIPIILAIGFGVRYIERHFKLEDNSSPDSKFSLTPKEWKHMVNIGEQTLLALGDGVKRVMDNEKESIKVQRRSHTDWMRPL